MSGTENGGGSNPACQDNNHGEGFKYLGTLTVETDGGGAGTFKFNLTGTFPAGTAITSTATELVNNKPGSTSEFSTCLVIQ